MQEQLENYLITLNTLKNSNIMEQLTSKVKELNKDIIYYEK